MRTAVTAPKNRLEVVPSPQNEGAKPLIWPRFSPFQRLGHLTAHPRAHFCAAAARSTFQPATLCRITRNTLPRPRTLSRFNPSRFFKPLLVDSMPERLRVPLRKHRGLLFPPPPSQAMGLVGELQGVATVSSLVNRAGVAEGASPADLRRHLDPRRARFLVPLDHQRRVSLRTGFHPPGPFVHGEVVERQGRGVDFRLAAGDWRRQLHAASLGRLHVLVAAVEGVGQHHLWQQLRLFELIEHRHHRPAVGLRGALRQAPVINCTSFAGLHVSASCTW